MYPVETVLRFCHVPSKITFLVVSCIEDIFKNLNSFQCSRFSLWKPWGHRR